MSAEEFKAKFGSQVHRENGGLEPLGWRAPWIKPPPRCVWGFTLYIQGHLLRRRYLDLKKNIPTKHRTSGGMTGCLGSEWEKKTLILFTSAVRIVMSK